MKKIFTLIASSMMAFASMAQTTTNYNCALAVIVDGEAADPQDMVVSTTKATDGTYTLELKNFVLYTAGEPLPVGTINVPNIKAEIDEDGDTILNSKQDITIANGDDPNVGFWLGPTLQTVPISLDGTITADGFGAMLNIPFGSMNIQVIVSSAVSKIGNSDFEDWHTASYKGLTKTYTSDEPNNWHSFMSCTGSLASAVSSTTHTFKSTDVRPGSTGKTSVKVISSAVLGKSANGTITTGRLNAGDMTASNTKNHSFIDLANTDLDANGDPFYAKLNNFPDSLALWVKYHPGKGCANAKALVSAIITDGSKYQDPEDENTTYTNIVGKAKNENIESNGEVWQRIVVPFDYESYYDTDTDPRAILVTVSTCAVPGGGSTDNSDPDAIWVDDLSLIYNAKLNSISIKGAELENFDKDAFTYNVTVDALPTVDDIDYEEDAENSLTLVSMKGNVAYLDVISNDLKTINVYKLNFKVNDTGIENTKTNANVVATYGVNGQKLSSSAKNRIQIKKYADGSVRKVAK